MDHLLSVQSCTGWAFPNRLFGQDVKQPVLNGRIPNASGQIHDAVKKLFSCLCKSSVHTLMNPSYYS